MSSTILSSLGEAVLHRNSLATITDNWIVVREAETCSQILIPIHSITQIKTFTTVKLHYLASSVGCLLIAGADACSKEPDGATLPFLLAGTALLIATHVTRQASVGLLANPDAVRTAYGSLTEAATLLRAIRSTQAGKRWVNRPAYEFFSWLREYITLLV